MSGTGAESMVETGAEDTGAITPVPAIRAITATVTAITENSLIIFTHPLFNIGHMMLSRITCRD
jgi:hypothetical protein